MSEFEQDFTVTPPPGELSQSDLNVLLYRAADSLRIPLMAEALANGANSNWPNMADSGKTAIVKTINTVSGWVTSMIIILMLSVLMMTL